MSWISCKLSSMSWISCQLSWMSWISCKLSWVSCISSTAELGKLHKLNSKLDELDKL